MSRQFFSPLLVGALMLIPFAAHAQFTDNFSSGLNPAYWTVTQTTPGLYSVNTSSGNVTLAKTANNSPGGFQSVAVNLNLAAFGGPVSGNFSTQIDFSNAVVAGSNENQVVLNTEFQSGATFDDVYDNSSGLNTHVWDGIAVRGATSAANNFGTFQISRTGSTLSGYYDGSLIFSETNASPLTALTFSLQNNGTNDPISAQFDNFAFSETPLSTPEPGSIALLFAGGSILCVSRLRKRSRTSRKAGGNT